MSHDKQWVLDKVKKLFTLATNDGATEGERNTAMRMAHSLLAKYNVDISEAEAHGGAPTEKRGVKSAEFFGRPWARIAIQSIARLFFCDYIVTPATKAKSTHHHFIGLETNAEAGLALAEYVVTSIYREAKRSAKGNNAYYRSFATGAALRVFERVTQLIQKASTPIAGSSMALVVQSLYLTEPDKNKAVKEAVFQNLGKPRSGSQKLEVSGFHQSREFGDKVTLSLNSKLENRS